MWHVFCLSLRFVFLIGIYMALEIGLFNPGSFFAIPQPAATFQYHSKLCRIAQALTTWMQLQKMKNKQATNFRWSLTFV
jgi:hypothetical protein